MNESIADKIQENES